MACYYLLVNRLLNKFGRRSGYTVYYLMHFIEEVYWFSFFLYKFIQKILLCFIFRNLSLHIHTQNLLFVIIKTACLKQMEQGNI